MDSHSHKAHLRAGEAPLDNRKVRVHSVHGAYLAEFEIDPGLIYQQKRV